MLFAAALHKICLKNLGLFRGGAQKMIKLSFYYGLSAQDTSIWLCNVSNALSFLLIPCKTVWCSLHVRSSYVTVEHVVGNNLYALSASLIFWQVFRQNMRRWLWEPPSLAQVARGREGQTNDGHSLTLVYLLGNKNIWKDFTSSLGSPTSSISVFAPPLELYKQVF